MRTTTTIRTERKTVDGWTVKVAWADSPADFANEQPMDISFACFQGWINIARTSHWLEAAAASACSPGSSCAAWGRSAPR